MVLTILVSIIEIISIGAVLPFLSVLTNPEIAFSHPMGAPFKSAFKISSHEDLLFYITLMFIVALIFSSIMRMLHLWITARVSNAIGSDLSYKIYQSFLEKQYSEIVELNSSEIINAVLTKVDRAVLQIIIPALNLISSLIMTIFILWLLFFINPIASLVTLSTIGAIYVVISILTRKRLLNNSEYIAYSSDRIAQLIQESKGSIKDIILGNMHTRYYSKFRDLDWKYRYKQGVNLVINQSPRFIVEAMGASIIVILAYSINDSQSVIPTLGVLVFGMQRLLPQFQIIYRSWSTVQGGMASFLDVVNLISNAKTSSSVGQKSVDFSFQKEISLKDVSYRHNNKQKYIFRHVNLTIFKGACVGIIGTSGSGKTTLVDLIMGLIIPSNGELRVDNVPVSYDSISSWQSHISHVPQEVFLVDASIEENIALGFSKEEINKEKLQECIVRAQLQDLVDSLPKKEETIVGEGGMLFSGGQRQRIAIARALYSDANVFIFDEATSALDQETEREVMSVLNNIKNDIVVMIVSHRVSILKSCDQIIDMDKINK